MVRAGTFASHTQSASKHAFCAPHHRPFPQQLPQLSHQPRQDIGPRASTSNRRVLLGVALVCPPDPKYLIKEKDPSKCHSRSKVLAEGLEHQRSLGAAQVQPRVDVAFAATFE